jgi:hypothetical protein
LCRNCLLKHIIEGKIGGIEVTGRHGRRYKQVLDDLKEMRGYCRLKEEALDHRVWRTNCGRIYGPIIRQTMVRVNKLYLCVLNPRTDISVLPYENEVVFVFIFHPKNYYRMISDTSKKEDLQKRERKKKHIITLEQHITRTIRDFLS